MLSSVKGRTILDGFLQTTFEDKDGNKKKEWIKFEDVVNVYLGLLTVLPKDNEEAYVEEGNTYYFKEPTDPEYHRIKLNDKNPLKKLSYISAAREEIVQGEDGLEILSAYVTNPTYIMFPETSEDWGNIAGFGLFTEATGTNLPYIWGTITGLDGESAVSVGPEEIPIIRANNFKISLR